MASLTIRDLDECLKAQLRVRAAVHGRSMEGEARHILWSALCAETAATGLVASIRGRLDAAGGGVDLELPVREAINGRIDFTR